MASGFIAACALFGGACSGPGTVPRGTDSAGASGVAGGAVSGAGGSDGSSGSPGSGAGGVDAASGASGTPSAGAAGQAVSYAINPPDPCNNRFSVPNCTSGMASSACGGKCTSINACQESTATKPGADVTFVCPRFMLFSDEMAQAAIDDGNTGFNYAVVGHDKDTGGIDGSDLSTCCQCYQLVFDYPAENQANVSANPEGPSAIPIPPPLVVQSFNTATNGPDDFDVFMAAGGYGGNNACNPNFAQHDVSGLYMYSTFPDTGDSGGVKGAGSYSECKTSTQWVTTESLSSAACQDRIRTTCNDTASNSPTMTRETIHSCIQSNDPSTYYHLNWFVRAKKVECPQHLTEVTGCRLAPQGLPAVDRSVTSAAQAAGDATFKDRAANGNRFSTTTMQDCCKPTCAWQDNVSGLGLTPVGNYDSFYSCTQDGVPLTQ